MSRADVVVIGAGIMDASVAWYLTTLGVRDVLLVDAGAAPGAGSTGRATGGYRAQYASAINVHGEARSLDVGALRPGRFAEGTPNPAPVLL